MKRVIKSILKLLGLIIGVRQDKYVNMNLCDFSGQGRDEFGK